MRSLDSQLGLGFLLSLGALPISGCATDKDEEDTGGSSPTSVGTDLTTGASNSGTEDTANTDASAEGMDASAEASAEGTDTSADASASGTTDATDSSDSVDTGGSTTAGSTGGSYACAEGPIPPACQAWAVNYAECYPRYARYADDVAGYCACYVVYSEMDGGPACGQAIEDYYACLGALSCEVLLGEEPYCEGEAAAIDEACNFGSTTGAMTDGG